MIAAAIGLFMTGIIASLYLNMRGSFRYQEDFGRLQESGRFAMSMISRDVRMAGYNGCGSVTEFANVVTGGESNRYLNFTQPIMGYDGGNWSSVPSDIKNVDVNGDGTTDGAIQGSDVILVLGADTSSDLVVQSHNTTQAKIVTSANTVKTGEILMVTNCGHATLFQVSGITGGIEHNTGGGVSPGNCTKFLRTSCSSSALSYEYKAGSSLFRVYSNAYFVAPSSTGSGRSLYAMSMLGTTGGTPVISELVEGVEGLQVTYGIDTNNDRAADKYVNASSVTNWQQVVLVQASLLVKSRKANLTSTDQTENFNGTSITDRRIQKIFTESITLRNRTP